jgi:hypothetical protein
METRTPCAHWLSRMVARRESSRSLAVLTVRYPSDASCTHRRCARRRRARPGRPHQDGARTRLNALARLRRPAGAPRCFEDPRAGPGHCRACVRGRDPRAVRSDRRPTAGLLIGPVHSVTRAMSTEPQPAIAKDVVATFKCKCSARCAPEPSAERRPTHSLDRHFHRGRRDDRYHRADVPARSLRPAARAGGRDGGQGRRRQGARSRWALGTGRRALGAA